MGRKPFITSDVLFLEKLRNTGERKKILASATPQQIALLRNILYNVLYNKQVHMTKKEKKKLQPYKKIIKMLASKKTKPRSARKRLIQSGGFLPLILPLIMSLVGTVGGKLLNKVIPI